MDVSVCKDQLASLYNNIFWDNQATKYDADDFHIMNTSASQVVLYSNNFDMTSNSGFKVGSPVYIDPTNKNKITPLFVDETISNFHLSVGSLMIDAGYPGTPDLPESDIEGTPRVLGASVDIGAYEYDDGSDPKAILTVTKAGNGTGTLTSSPAGINCGSDCVQAFTQDTPVALIATPTDTNSTFAGWNGADDCTDGQVTMDTHKTCTGTFSAQRQLTITKIGGGSGNVTSSPTGINCGTACSAYYLLNQPVTLTTTPMTGSRFSGWSGADDCANGQVTMTTALGCTAQFDLIHYPLLVLFPGTGTGTVTSSPAGINCGTDCQEDYPAGTPVTLTATAQQGSTFNGWAGACSGNGATCQVTITELTGVTANFTALTPGTSNTLYVTSTGGGTVTSAPTGINCGTACEADFDSAQVVTLTPTSNPGLTFNGWRGACAGTGPCQIPMTNDQAVMAAFGATYPSQLLLLQQDHLTGTGTYAAPRLVILGPALTVVAGSDLTVEAGEQIKFLPGFKVEKNATFKARINPTLKP